MIAEQDARKLVASVVETLRKQHGEPTDPPEGELLERALLEILTNGSSGKTGEAALAKLRNAFVDWNEARVSTLQEITACIGKPPAAEAQANAVRGLLQALFRECNEVCMDPLREASPSDARAFIEQVEGVEPAVGYRILMVVLGHACVPVTPEIARVCARLDLVREDYDEEQMQKRLERILAKAQMPAFLHVMLHHARATCLADKPKCKQCALRKECAYTGK